MCRDIDGVRNLHGRREMNCYTLKLRHTGSSNHGRGGEGAMVTENLSCTISTLQDQTLFQTGGGHK